MATRDKIICAATDSAIKQCKASQTPMDTKDIVNIIFEETRQLLSLENATLPKTDRLPKVVGLVPYQIARCIAEFEIVACIRCTQEVTDLEREPIGVYQTDGPDKGIYATDAISLKRLMRKYNPTITLYEIKEVEDILRTMIKHVRRSEDRDLIAVNNGVIDYRTKKLLPFSPDMVFTTKSKVNYDPMAKNIVIHNPDDGTDWDVESWMRELSDDPEIVYVLWKILGAIIRPHVSWNKSAWLFATTGNNGKGTLCALMRNLCGEGSHCSIKLTDFNKDFLLEPLVRSSAIIVDENDVGIYIDKSATLKAVITNDVIQINRKFKAAIDIQFKGFMVQCLNEMPRVKDKSNSFYRRQLFIPFTKCFTGMERKYIKDDYLKRPEVLEYVLMRVITMPDYYTLDEPQACKDALEQYKTYNDPVRSFAEDFLPECKWDLLPYEFLYDAYKAWCKRYSPSGVVQGRNTFVNDLKGYVDSAKPGWVYRGKGADGKELRTVSKGKMDVPEPLILEYKLENWYNPNYTGHDTNKVCMPKSTTVYRGLIRESVADPDNDNDDDNDNGGNEV